MRSPNNANHQPLVLFFFFSTFALFLYLSNTNTLSNTSTPYKYEISKEPKKEESTKPLIILFWTTILSKEPNMTGACSSSTPPCIFTSDRSLFPNASAVVFHVSEFRDDGHIKLKPFTAQQKFVFFSLEAPPSLEFAGAGRWWKNEIKFHWIASYEQHAHVHVTYGNISKLTKNMQPVDNLAQRSVPALDNSKSNSVQPLGNSTKEEILSGKKVRGAAWFVSNCSPQERMRVAKAMQRNKFRVDIGGRCSRDQKLKCDVEANCEHIISQYYFYLSFENANCMDYVTEKIFRRLYANTPVIPIVMKRSVYKNVLPPEAFIAIDDFASVKKLVAHLNYLMDNPNEYYKLFEWRRKWTRTGFWEPCENRFGFCFLCEKLHNERDTVAEWIPDTKKWFEKNSKCEPAVKDSWYK